MVEDLIEAYVEPTACPPLIPTCSQLEGRLLTKFWPLISLSSGAGVQSVAFVPRSSLGHA